MAWKRRQNSPGTNEKNALNNPSAICCLAFISFFALSAYAGSADGTNPIEGGRFTHPRFRTSVNLTEGFDDNTTTAHDNRTGSAFTSVQANAFADLGTPRTGFTIGVGVGANYYYSRPGSKWDKNASLTLSVTHHLNERLTLSLASSLVYQVQPDFTLLVNQNRISGQYFYTADNLSASYKWTPRFSTVTSYQLVGIFYEDSVEKVANDYFAQTFSNQFRFLLLPKTSLVTEYDLSVVNYLYQSANNSITNTATVGVDHTFSPRFSVSMRAGASIQSHSQGGMALS